MFYGYYNSANRLFFATLVSISQLLFIAQLLFFQGSFAMILAAISLRYVSGVRTHRWTRRGENYKKGDRAIRN